MTASARGPATVGAIVATVLILVGVLVWFTAPNESASFGWFAYEPLPEYLVLPARWFALYAQQLVAVVLAVIGLFFAGVTLGYWWGRSARATSQLPGPDPFSHPSKQ